MSSSNFKGREHRAACYKARDEYFECLDKSGEKLAEECRGLLGNFESTCGEKWTEHFIRRRDYLKFKEKMEKEGADVFDEAKFGSKKNN